MAGRDVAASLLHVELDVELSALVVHSGQIQLRVGDLEVLRKLDVGGSHRSGAAAVVKDEHAGAVRERAQADLLDVEEELDGVLLDVGNRRELVLDAFDADGRDRGAR